MRTEIWARSLLHSCSIVLILVVTIGCMKTPPGYVAREWSTTMRELAITPVFPPREDVQVGDIYMAPTAPNGEQEILDKKGFLPMGLWVSTAKIKENVKKCYSDRISFPATVKTSSDQPCSSGDNVFNDVDAKRMRLVGFPIFMTATLSEGSLSGLIPIEAVSMTAAAGFTQGRRVTVSVPRAESYGIPAAEMIAKLLISDQKEKKRKWSAQGTGGFEAKDLALYLPQEQERILKSDPGWTNNKYGYVRVITEVFYARELDIAIESTRGAGFTLDVRPAATVPPVGSGPSTPSGPNAGPGDPSPDSQAGKAAPPADGKSKTPDSSNASAKPSELQFQEPTPQQIAAELNRQLDAGAARGTPGVGTRFVTAGSQGVGLRVTFERPIAIGYRGMLMRLYEDGTVEGAGPVGAVMPTAKPAEQ